MKALGGKSIAMFSQRISYAACFPADFFSFRNFIHCFLLGQKEGDKQM